VQENLEVCAGEPRGLWRRTSRFVEENLEVSTRNLEVLGGGEPRGLWRRTSRFVNIESILSTRNPEVSPGVYTDISYVFEYT
jgi:hypothetical protein